AVNRALGRKVAGMDLHATHADGPDEALLGRRGQDGQSEPPVEFALPFGVQRARLGEQLPGCARPVRHPGCQTFASIILWAKLSWPCHRKLCLAVRPPTALIRSDSCDTTIPTCTRGCRPPRLQPLDSVTLSTNSRNTPPDEP